MADSFPTISTLGDQAMVVQLASRMDAAAFSSLRALARQLDAYPLPGMMEIVPALTTLTIYYNPLACSPAELEKGVRRSIARLDLSAEPLPRIVEIPVCYGGQYGCDLEFVAEHAGLTPEEVIENHSSPDYLVHMIGFAPGFPYLGGMSPKIAAPRRITPRLKVPAGSVGIAGEQTGIYPLETPGGWQLIGRTPLALFRPQQSPPTLLVAGDIVRFYAIAAEEFSAHWESQA